MRSTTLWISSATIVVAAALIIILPIQSGRNSGKDNDQPNSSRAERPDRPGRKSKSDNKRKLSLADAETRNGKHHAPGEADSFTGTLEEEHNGGGLKATIPMKNGVPHGTMREYDENGTLRRLARYENGRLVELREWDKNGVELGEPRRGDPFAELLADRENRLRTPEATAGTGPRPINDALDPSQGVHISSIQEKSGVAYEIGSNQPYSGPAVQRYDDGSRYERHYQDGRRHGEFTSYYANGQVRSRENFENGRKNGLYTRWHENGTKAFEANIVNGRVVGVMTTWNQEGDVLSMTEYTEDGRQINLLQSPPPEDDPSPEEAPEDSGQPSPTTPNP